MTAIRDQTLVIDDEPAGDGRNPRLLVTNDDGIESPGIHSLARRLAADFDVIVVAPREDMSGTGTALGRFDPEVGVQMRTHSLDGVDRAYSVDGPPGLAVLASALGAFGRKPDMVVSGVNAGLNTGHSVLHSGTVGAALTARSLGMCGLAVSLDHSEPWRWDEAAEVAASAASWLIEHGPGAVLNINVPGRPLWEVKGATWADLDAFGHIRLATANVPGEILEFEVRTASTGEDPLSDTALCRQGFVTATLLESIEPAPTPAHSAADIWAPAPSER
ncbi:MAG: 5'/3'-nucleotidase SurE [Acidimicrobiia bacterium]|nr:5'/3'-nucleotidase SurE [Acidimicrobiia bacterium]